MQAIQYAEFRVESLPPPPTAAASTPDASSTTASSTEKLFGEELCIGLVAKDHPLNKHLGATRHSYAVRLSDGRTFENGKVAEPIQWLPPIVKGDVIGLGLDLREKHIFMTHNGQYCGTIFRNVPVYRPYHVAVSLGATRQAVYIERYAQAYRAAGSSNFTPAFKEVNAPDAVDVKSNYSGSLITWFEGKVPPAAGEARVVLSSNVMQAIPSFSNAVGYFEVSLLLGSLYSCVFVLSIDADCFSTDYCQQPVHDEHRQCVQSRLGELPVGSH
jgi:hypothetical protein